jgi:hypothetical protein
MKRRLVRKHPFGRMDEFSRNPTKRLPRLLKERLP